MRLLELACLVPLAILAPACQSTSSSAAKTDTSAKAKSGGESDEEKDSKEEKLKKKEREVDDARLQLTIAKQETQAAERKAKDDVEEAEYTLGKAKEALDHFQKVTRGLELSRADLGFDRAKQRAEESKAELEELMSMYKKEDFAALTKELVLTRGQKNLEFANRALEQERIEQAATRDVELPRKEKDLQLALHKAENKLREEKADQQKLTNENELKMRKAERAVDDAVAALDKMKAAQTPKTAATPETKAAKP
jgi:hypothetical protein